MSSTANRIAKNTGWLYAKMAITMFISLYTTRIILDVLGVEDFGIYNIVGGAIAMLGFINSSMAVSTQRYMSYATGHGQHERQKFIFNVSYIIHIALSLITVLVFIIAGVFFFNGILNIPTERHNAAIVVYGCLIVSTFFTMISVPYEAALNAHENMRYFTFVGIIESVFKLIVALLLVHSPIDKLVFYGLLMTLIPIIVLSIMRVYCHLKYEECHISFKKYWDKSLAKEMTSFAGWGLASSTASMLTMQGMSILLNMFGGVVVNAAHGVANQLAGQLMIFSNNMLKALNPVLVKSYGAGENAKMLDAASTGNKLSYLILSFFAVPFIIETPFILNLWLKETPDWAILFVRLVLIRQMISQMYITLETCISATGNIKDMSVASTIIWIAPIPISYELYRFGAPIYTIYIVLIITAFVRGSNAIYYCKKQCGLSVHQYLFQTVSPCILHLLIVTCFVYLISLAFDTGFVRLLIVFITSSVIHLSVCFFVTFNCRERRIIRDLISNIRIRLLKHE